MAGSIRVALTLEQCWHRVPGGTARAAVETAAVLAERTDLELIGVSAKHREPPDVPFRPPIPVKQHLLPRRALYDAWHHLRWPAVSRATGPVQVIHATGIVMPPPSAPIVWTLHDVAWRRDPSLFTRRGVRFFEQALQLAERDARIVLCSSQATMDDAVEAGLDPDRLRLVPLGVRPRLVSDDEIRTVRKRRDLRRPYVLSVGTIEPRKNLPTLVEAFTGLARAGLDLVLVGPDGWHENLEGLVEPLGERARPLGFVAEGELATLYAGASAFAYPSSWEGFGLPVLEAMAYGAPVVTSAGTACAEVTGDAALLIDPKDPVALHDALTRVLEDRDLADRLRHDGRLRASHFTWERTAELAAAAYHEVAGLKIGVNLLWLVPGQVGGTEEYTVRLLDHLADTPGLDDVDVTVFASRATLDAHASLRARFHAVEGPAGAGRPGRVLVEASWLAEHTRRARLDLVHHLGGTVPLVRGAPAVVTIHDLQPLHHPDAFSPVKRRWLGLMLPHAVRHARLVVAVSRFTADDVHDRLGVPADRIRVVRHGFDRPEQPVAPAEIERVRARYDLGAHWFTYPAVTWRHKNHITLVRAFAPVAAGDPDVTLVLTGAAGEAESEVQQEIARLGLGPRVRRTGRISRSEVDAVIAGATAVTIPSTFEGFGAPTAEAMALGAPVVASTSGALPEVTGDAAILLDPLDVDAWTRSMRTLLTEPETRRRMIDAGWQRAGTLGWDEPVGVLVATWRDALVRTA